MAMIYRKTWESHSMSAEAESSIHFSSVMAKQDYVNVKIGYEIKEPHLTWDLC